MISSQTGMISISFLDRFRLSISSWTCIVPVPVLKAVGHVQFLNQKGWCIAVQSESAEREFCKSSEKDDTIEYFEFHSIAHIGFQVFFKNHLRIVRTSRAMQSNWYFQWAPRYFKFLILYKKGHYLNFSGNRTSCGSKENKDVGNASRCYASFIKR